MRDDEEVANHLDLLDDFESRGLIQSTTDREMLAGRLSSGPITLYCGFDPTADSLHVGSLLGLVMLRRFADAGHHPLVLLGGATGMIGDPSGRSSERNLLDADALAHNKASIAAQISSIMGDSRPWSMVDNAEWTSQMSFVDFLRDVGKHVTVNTMIARESVSARMESEYGISFTEFAYQLLQANDFWWLHTHRGCDLQVGGSDQWGNIVAGVDLIRRRGGGGVHGLTWPLLLRADGTKFGKSASGESIWLDPLRTSPYRFFQFWMHTEDADVVRLLRQLTLMAVGEIDALAAKHDASPGRRLAQARLAEEMTMLVHGAEATSHARNASQALFGGSVEDLSADAFTMLVDEIPTWRLSPSELTQPIPMVDAFHRSGLCTSKGEARRALEQGGGYCNGRRVDVDTALDTTMFLHRRFALLRRGRKAYALAVAA